MSTSARQRLVDIGRDVHGRYQAFSLRERVLVGLAVFSATWMVWNITVGGFLEQSEADISRNVNDVYTRLQNEVAEQTRLQQELANDPDARLKQERHAIDQELKLLNATLGSVLDRFVPPQKMPELLRDVIRDHDGLKLKRITKLPVEAVVTKADPAKEAEPPVAIYRHSMRLEFEGEYFEVLAYLSDLENSEWELGWRELNYEVADYPLAEVSIEIETLSREKGWIGV